MSQDNVELIRAMWPHEIDVVELVADSESRAGLAAGLAPDAEVAFIANAPGVPDLRYRGAEGLTEGWRDWLEPYESYRLEIEDAIDAGDDEVLVRVRVSARTRRDGVLIEHAPAAICTVKARQIVRVRFYLDRDQALEAARLRE
ncbi:MAG: nuclear transport factor 2 family protein [Solirubrobacteraceae bacterium]|jgi:ketosteroid isomerase-like protein